MLTLLCGLQAALCRFAQRMQAALPAMRRAVDLPPTATQYRTVLDVDDAESPASPPDDGWPAVAAMLCAVRACSALVTRLPAAEDALRRQLAEPLTAALGPSRKPGAAAAPALLARARPLLGHGMGCALLAVRCGVEGRIAPSPVVGGDRASPIPRHGPRRSGRGGSTMRNGDGPEGAGAGGEGAEGQGSEGEREEDEEEDGASVPDAVREALRVSHSPCTAAERRQLQQLASLLGNSAWPRPLAPAAAAACV